jgi:hypothetical protein
MIALVYSAERIRDKTIVGATNLDRGLGEQSRDSLLTDDRILRDPVTGDALPHLVFSESCRGAFATPSRSGVDRNVFFRRGMVDFLGHVTLNADGTPERKTTTAPLIPDPERAQAQHKL